MLQYLFFYDVVVLIFSMLHYIFYVVVVFCSLCFLMLKYIFLRYCNIYNPMLHYISFPYIFAMLQLKCFMLIWDKGMVGNELR